MRRVLLHALLCALTSEVFACLPGYNTGFNGVCYKFVYHYDAYYESNYAKLKAVCDYDGTVIPYIQNESDNYFYAIEGGGNDVVYLGLTCDMRKNKFLWSDGTPLTYSNFASGTDSSFCNSTDHFALSCDDGKWYHLNHLSLNKNAKGFCAQPRLVTSDPCDDFTSIPGGKGDSGICYSLVSAHATWQDAEKKCRNDFGHLMSIHGSQQNDFLRRLAVSHGLVNGVYLGIRAADAKQNYTWSDGSVRDYDQFSPGFPDPDFGLCGAMETGTSKGDWVSLECTTQLPYFCGKQADVATTPTPSTCPETLIYTEGKEITSPGFPAGFPGDLECDYLLKVGSGKHAQIEVIYFETNSCCDFLHVFNGTLGDNHVATLSGSNLSGNKYASNSNIMRLSWRPTSGVAVRGWKVVVEAV